jgi:hypothetical protein
VGSAALGRAPSDVAQGNRGEPIDVARFGQPQGKQGKLPWFRAKWRDSKPYFHITRKLAVCKWLRL